MFDATKLLGALLEQRPAPPAASGRPGDAPDRGGPGANGSPLAQFLSQLAGAAGQPSGAGVGNPLGELLSRLGATGAGGGLLGGSGGGVGNPLGEFLSRLGAAGAGGGLLGGSGEAAAGPAGGGAGRPGAADPLGGLVEMARRAVAEPRREIGRNNPVVVGGLGALAGTLLGAGLLAVLGSLAYAALQANGGGAPAAPPGAPEEADRSATLALKAMVQAAKADGQLDAREAERIAGRLREAGEGPAARDLVLRELDGPADVEALAREARGPKDAAEVYAASLMAIEVDTEAERDHLARLATALGLSQPTVAFLHHTLGVPAP